MNVGRRNPRSTTIAPPARTAAIAALLGLVAAGTLVGFAGAAHAAPVPSANHTGMYGDPAAAAPYWRRQHFSNCAEMAVADVVGQVSGREPTEDQADATAEKTASASHSGSIWHPGGSTSNGDLPVLLAHYGVRAQGAQTDIGSLEQDLGRGRKVIVALNSEIIWNQAGDRGQEDHFVVVTGIDTRAGVVHLNDSGANSGRDEQVSLAKFERSWATSRYFAVVTT